MKYKLFLPYHYGAVVQERLKTLEVNTNYDGYTLNEKLEIITCKCSIRNDGMYNYHNNYDDSQNVLMVGNTHQWWTLNKSEILKIQKEHLEREIKKLEEELNRLKSIQPE